MIARVCYVYHYTPDQARTLTVLDFNALMEVAEEAAEAARAK